MTYWLIVRGEVMTLKEKQGQELVNF